jgi:organic radical activating enzyme
VSEPALRVVESFVSLQGEGYFAGTRALFVRLAGCNAVAAGLDCSDWCDTRYAWDERQSGRPIVALASPDFDLLVQSAYERERPELLVFTGGEPLLQRQALGVWFRDYASWRSFARVCFETNGTQPRDFLPSEVACWFTVSPKGPDYRLERGPVDEVKVVVTAAMRATVPGTVALLRRLADYGDHHFLQPQDNDLELAAWAANTLLRECPGWRLSLQLHKLLNVP